MSDLSDMRISHLARGDAVQNPRRRFRVLLWSLLAAVIVSFMMALFFNAENGFPWTAWACIMAGPCMAGMFPALHWSTPMGWVGMLLIWAHPIRPNVLTGMATVLGVILWLIAGLVTYAGAAYAG